MFMSSIFEGTAGQRFQQALALENPLQIVGTINAYTALLAKRASARRTHQSRCAQRAVHGSGRRPREFQGRRTDQDLFEDP